MMSLNAAIWRNRIRHGRRGFPITRSWLGSRSGRLPRKTRTRLDGAAAVTTPRAEAEANQRAASNPAVSAFVAASAGSGKTRLLTDRLLRLMVGGAKPERILCLTFTKAAAAEMALRLQRRLGEWVTMREPALRAELRKLDIEPAEATIRRAR